MGGMESKKGVSSHVTRTMGWLHTGPVSPLDSVTGSLAVEARLRFKKHSDGVCQARAGAPHPTSK